MKLSDFDFDLPLELIAQHPAEKRDNSNLLIATQNIVQQTKFYNIIDYLLPGDLIVFNDSKVIKAKLKLNKNGKKIDLYLNKKISDDCWRGFAKPARKLQEGDQFDFNEHKIIINKKLEMGEIEVKFPNISVFDFLEQYGETPLPPYIKRLTAQEEDTLRYQTVYNNQPGSVAAPTAGLHFTEELLKKIRDKGVETTFITLHVGAGTFLPVKTEDIDQHKMHSEYYSISQEAASAINKAKKENRRIIAVGTTTLRTLESAAINGPLQVGEFETKIFIRPGFKFQLIDMLITNFHLPKSTLFMLICAFAGYHEMTKLYEYAIQNKMHFFSYGDACLLKRKD